MARNAIELEGFFSCNSPFCVQAEEVHCVVDTLRKEASLELLSAVLLQRRSPKKS